VREITLELINVFEITILRAVRYVSDSSLSFAHESFCIINYRVVKSLNICKFSMSVYTVLNHFLVARLSHRNYINKIFCTLSRYRV